VSNSPDGGPDLPVRWIDARGHEAARNGSFSRSATAATLRCRSTVVCCPRSQCCDAPAGPTGPATVKPLAEAPSGTRPISTPCTERGDIRGDAQSPPDVKRKAKNLRFAGTRARSSVGERSLHTCARILDGEALQL